MFNRRFPSNRQLDCMDCGPTALKNVVEFYGANYSISLYRSLIYTNRAGCSLYDISRAANRLGFETLAVNIGMDLISEIPLPAIFHWDQRHFIVVYRVDKNRIYVSDPAFGLISYSRDEFQQHWFTSNSINQSGIALLLSLAKKIEIITDPSPKSSSLRKFIQHYLNPHKAQFVKVLFSLIVGAILQLLLPILMQNVTDFGILGKNKSIIWLILLGQLSLTSGLLVFELFRSWTLLFVSSRINLFLITDFFIKLLSLPVGFFDSKITGDILQRINDHKRIENFITSSVVNLIFSIFTLLLYCCVLIIYSKEIFFVFIFGTIIYVTYVVLFMKKRESLDYKYFQLASENNTKIFELINSVQEIKLNNAENNKRWQIEILLLKVYRLRIQQTKLDQTQNIGARLINEGKNLIITIIAATYVIDGTMSMGNMIALMYITGQLNQPVLQLVGINKALQEARISLNRIDSIYSIKSEEEKDVLYDQIKDSENPLTFKNVYFQYNANMPFVLKDVSFSIPKNKTTAIVGGSGSGKSTLLKLILKFYLPTDGDILLGDIDFNTLNLENWRNNCGVVMQEGQLFNDSVAGNICLDTDKLDKNRLISCAKEANIFDFIESLPQGFDTKIGGDGLGISTGQKQRILIARAVYKKPSILIFDEATSSLDAENENKIVEYIYDAFPTVTKIIVAHRLNTIKNADNIIVLDNGKVVENGNHNELIAKNGYYYNLFNKQLK